MASRREQLLAFVASKRNEELAMGNKHNTSASASTSSRPARAATTQTPRTTAAASANHTTNSHVQRNDPQDKQEMLRRRKIMMRSPILQTQMDQWQRTTAAATGANPSPSPREATNHRHANNKGPTKAKPATPRPAARQNKTTSAAQMLLSNRSRQVPGSSSPMNQPPQRPQTSQYVHQPSSRAHPVTPTGSTKSELAARQQASTILNEYRNDYRGSMQGLQAIAEGEERSCSEVSSDEEAEHEQVTNQEQEPDYVEYQQKAMAAPPEEHGEQPEMAMDNQQEALDATNGTIPHQPLEYVDRAVVLPKTNPEEVESGPQLEDTEAFEMEQVIPPLVPVRPQEPGEEELNKEQQQQWRRQVQEQIEREQLQQQFERSRQSYESFEVNDHSRNHEISAACKRLDSPRRQEQRRTLLQDSLIAAVVVGVSSCVIFCQLYPNSELANELDNVLNTLIAHARNGHAAAQEQWSLLAVMIGTIGRWNLRGAFNHLVNAFVSLARSDDLSKLVNHSMASVSNHFVSTMHRIGSTAWQKVDHFVRKGLEDLEFVITHRVWQVRELDPLVISQARVKLLEALHKDALQLEMRMRSWEKEKTRVFETLQNMQQKRVETHANVEKVLLQTREEIRESMMTLKKAIYEDLESFAALAQQKHNEQMLQLAEEEELLAAQEAIQEMQETAVRELEEPERSEKQDQGEVEGVAPPMEDAESECQDSAVAEIIEDNEDIEEPGFPSGVLKDKAAMTGITDQVAETNAHSKLLEQQVLQRGQDVLNSTRIFAQDNSSLLVAGTLGFVTLTVLLLFWKWLMVMKKRRAARRRFPRWRKPAPASVEAEESEDDEVLFVPAISDPDEDDNDEAYDDYDEETDDDNFGAREPEPESGRSSEGDVGETPMIVRRSRRLSEMTVPTHYG